MSLKRLALVGALLMAAMASPGCAQVAASLPPVANAPIRATLVDDKAWAASLATYVAVTNAYTAGVKNGLIPKAVVAQIAPLRQQAVTIRKAGQDAYALGNATNLAAQTTALTDIINKLRPLIPGAAALY
jgi:hypothetical protein